MRADCASAESVETPLVADVERAGDRGERAELAVELGLHRQAAAAGGAQATRVALGPGKSFRADLEAAHQRIARSSVRV